MLYIILLIGIIVLAVGLKKEKQDNGDFRSMIEQISENDHINVVNTTYDEEELKIAIEHMARELTEMKESVYRHAIRLDMMEGKGMPRGEEREWNNKTSVEYRQVKDKLNEVTDDQSLETLSKEMKVGKGELLLLQKLRKK